jgi:UDP-N-acetylmuramoyl-tripeptide--D-alanyl-D-alanine ligase
MIPLTLDEILHAVSGRAPEDLQPVSVTGVSIDSRTCRAGDVFFAIAGDRFDGHDFVDDALQAGAVAAVVHRELAASGQPIIRVEDTTGALGRLASYYRNERSLNVVAVTGSNGKTTTKGFIEHVLSQHQAGRAAPRSFNNAVGVPLTLLSSQPGDEYLVVEIGSNAPGEIATLSAIASPNIAVITSIGLAHLERFGDIEGVAAEKASLLDHLRSGGLAVVNADSPELMRRVGQLDAVNVITFGRCAEADVRVTDLCGSVDGVRFKINGRFEVSLPVPGEHNAMNAAAAFAVCRRLKLDPEQIVEALAGVPPPPSRLSVSRVGGVTLIDDSYNANPSSVAEAVEVLRCVDKGRRVLVMGDMLELGPDGPKLHEGCGRLAAEAGIEMIVAVGDHADSTLRGVLCAAGDPETVRYASTDDAVGDLPGRVRESDTVLFKGSRRMELERVFQAVSTVFTDRAPATSHS